MILLQKYKLREFYSDHSELFLFAEEETCALNIKIVQRRLQHSCAFSRTSCSRFVFVHSRLFIRAISGQLYPIIVHSHTHHSPTPRAEMLKSRESCDSRFDRSPLPNRARILYSEEYRSEREKSQSPYLNFFRI